MVQGGLSATQRGGHKVAIQPSTPAAKVALASAASEACGLTSTWALGGWKTLVMGKERGEGPLLIWGFPKIGVPQNGWFMMENLIKLDDLGVPLFSETSVCLHVFIDISMYKCTYRDLQKVLGPEMSRSNSWAPC